MRFTTVLSLCLAAFLSGCAIQGVVVEKRFRPLPFSDSLGVDGIYNFQLRDAQGLIHSQMVTPGVFALYEVGDYFDDLGTPPMHDGKDGGKDYRAPVRLMPPQFQPAPQPEDAVPYINVPIRPRPLRTRKTHGVDSSATTRTPSREIATAKKTRSSVRTVQKKHRHVKKSATVAKKHKRSKKSSHTASAHRHKKKSAKVTKTHKRSTSKKIAARG